jgi:hypothetical protein
LPVGDKYVLQAFEQVLFVFENFKEQVMRENRWNEVCSIRDEIDRLVRWKERRKKIPFF